MLSLVLLFAVWPFHHKKPAAVPEAITYVGIFEMLERDAEKDGCSMGFSEQSMFYFYLGEDNMIGISGASCADAKHQWQVTHIDPVRMSRS